MILWIYNTFKKLINSNLTYQWLNDKFTNKDRKNDRNDGTLRELTLTET